MPNWCQNTLNVSGDEKSIAAFLTAARGRHAGYKDFYDIDTRAWPAHDQVRVKALTKDPAPLSDREYDFCMNALYPVPLDFRRFPFDDNSAYKVGAIGGILITGDASGMLTESVWRVMIPFFSIVLIAPGLHRLHFLKRLLQTFRL